jgi:hypothetical protein
MVVVTVGVLEVSGGHRAMTRQEWHQPTDWNVVCARAAGRRKYNERRRLFAAQVCDELVWPLLLKYGFDSWGVCARIGREIGVSRATVCRYRQRILKALV